MTTSSALAFIRAVRENAELQRHVAALPHDVGLDQLCDGIPGYAFTPDEFAEAFRMDWMARWLYYRSRSASA